MAGQLSHFTDEKNEAQVAWHGLTDTFPSLKPEGSHLPTHPILSFQEPRTLGERGLYALQLRGVGMGGRVPLWLMPGRAEQLSHLEAFHMPVVLTYIEPPTEVQARTGLLPVLSMPACNALEETFMARAPSMIRHTPQQKSTVNMWHSVLVQTPHTKKVLKCVDLYTRVLCGFNSQSLHGGRYKVLW